MSAFSNFAVSFTIISILSGCLTLYGFGMNTGGPVMIVWGWPIVGVMTLFVGLAMAEVCSSYPTAGGLYYWSAKLAPAQRRRRGPGSPAGSTSSARSRSPPASTSAPRSSSTRCSTCSSASPPTPRHTIVLFGAILLAARPAEHVRRPAGRAAQRHQRLVARRRRGGHRRRAGARCPTHHQSAASCSASFVNNTGWESTLYVGAARPAARAVHASPATTRRRT